MTVQAPQLHMFRPSLADLPSPALAKGYGWRILENAGDECAWERIVDRAFRRPAGSHSFDRILRSDTAFREDRIFFVTVEGDPVGTATAYTRPTFMERAGMLHFVAVSPSHTGRGLGRAVSLLALRRMVADGFPRAWLSTDDFRLSAIATYLGLGFDPLLVHENQRERWRAVLRRLGLPLERVAGYEAKIEAAQVYVPPR